MKANELRIGNWVMVSPCEHPQQICDVMCDSVNTESVIAQHYGEVDPIPLTEEWLLKFGFGQLHENRWSDKYVIIHLSKNENGFLYLANQRHVNIFYVHQLQNLYFALTGEELTIGGQDEK